MMIHRFKKLAGKQDKTSPEYTYSQLQTIEEELGNDNESNEI
jgi:hypothetical protein